MAPESPAAASRVALGILAMASGVNEGLSALASVVASTGSPSATPEATYLQHDLHPCLYMYMACIVAHMHMCCTVIPT